MKDDRLRKAICRRSIFLFGVYYFTHYFFRPSAPFHKVMAEDLQFKEHKFLLWIMFRESAKTIWARIKVLHTICFAYKKNIGWISHDLRKSTKQVMAVANELKQNKKLIRDFGHLFFEDAHDKKAKSKFKTFGEFMTSNDIYIKALSTQVSTRGDIVDQFRPDFYVVDDIENLKTARSVQVTQGILEFIDEFIGGISVDCEVLILANRVANNGVVTWIENHLSENPRAVIHEVKIYRKDGSITWPEKFVETDKEATKINAVITNKKRHVVSLESKKRDLGSIGFAREMLNQPTDSAGSPVRLEWIKRGTYPPAETTDEAFAVDPAISEKQTADFFAVAGGGRHKESGKIYVKNSYKTRCGITEQVNLIVNFHKQNTRAVWRIETVAYQKALSQLIADQKKNGNYIPVEEFKPDTDKLRRLQAIVPFIERGDIIFCDGREIDDLVASLCAFPFAEHDDDVDAFVSLVEHFIQSRKTPSLLVSK